MLRTCSLISEQGFAFKVEMSSRSTITSPADSEFKLLFSNVLWVDNDCVFACWVTCKKLMVYILTKMFFF